MLEALTSSITPALLKKILFGIKLNLMIKLLQLPSDTLSALNSPRSLQIAIPAGWFIPGVYSLHQRQHKRDLEWNLHKPPTGSDREEERPLARVFPVRVLRRAAPRKWNSQVKSITLWHYTSSFSCVYQLLKHTLLVKDCKPLGDGSFCGVQYLSPRYSGRKMTHGDVFKGYFQTKQRIRSNTRAIFQ